MFKLLCYCILGFFVKVISTVAIAIAILDKNCAMDVCSRPHTLLKMATCTHHIRDMNSEKHPANSVLKNLLFIKEVASHLMNSQPWQLINVISRTMLLLKILLEGLLD